MMPRSKTKSAKGAKEWLEEKAATATNEDVKVAELKAENARLSKVLGLVEAYHAGAGEPPRWALPAKKHRPGAATACLQLSDMHFDEVVNPSEVGGLNAYSREIASRRLRRWAEKVAEMAERHAHAWDGALLIANGDDCSGAIHEELRETNEDVLPGTLVYWAPRLAAAVRAVRDVHGRVHVIKVVGNHGRLTTQKPFKRRARASWDWLLWQMVASHFASDDRVTFEFAGGSYIFASLYGRHIFVTHGDEVGGGGGWAGVWSPLGTIHRRAIELGQAHGLRPAYSVVGHWHQTVLAHHRGLVCNGAMKGWDEFAAGLRLRPEPAMQNWWVETPERGVTLAAPLFLEDRKAEGW